MAGRLRGSPRAGWSTAGCTRAGGTRWRRCSSTRSLSRRSRASPVLPARSMAFGYGADRWTNRRRGARLYGEAFALPKGAQSMESSTSPQRVLVVAHRTAATPALIEAVRDRAARGPTSFTLLVPNSAHGLHRVIDPEDQEAGEAQTVLDLALPLLEDAA